MFQVYVVAAVSAWFGDDDYGCALTRLWLCVVCARWWQGLAIPKHSVTRLISQDGGSIKSPLAGKLSYADP